MKVVYEGIVLALATALSVAACNPDQEAVQAGEAAGASEANKGFIIRNASLVLTMDPTLGRGTLGELHDVDVLIRGDHIAAVDPDLSAQGAQVIDGEGKIVMPGFIDTHDHLWQSLIVFNGQADNVTWVFVAGKPLKKNGQLVGVDLKKVLRDAQTAVADIQPAIQP